MITDTKDGQTNYCPNCEDQARRIEELERRERMFVEVIANAQCELVSDEGADNAAHILSDALNATPSHSAAWEWNQHVEWMKSLPTFGVWHQGDTEDESDFFFGDVVDAEEWCCTRLVAIPELKEVKE